MAWEAFLSAPVALNDFAKAKKMLSKILSNATAQPHEPKFRRLRPANEAVARTLFPEALAVLRLAGFEEEGDWLELPDSAVPGVHAWQERLATAEWEYAVPGGAQVALSSGFLSGLDLLRSFCVCRQIRRVAQSALLQNELIEVGGLDRLLSELCYDGWFSLRCQFTDGEPLEEFHQALIGQPLTCHAGGHKRLQRANFVDITSPSPDAFCRLNPWDMLKVGPNGLRQRPPEPSQEWWAKLNALFRDASSLKGRQWQWSELSSVHGRCATFHVRHLVYCLQLGNHSITITMRAIWDSAAP